MPKMRNISQRTFVIGGKTLKKGETGEFAQSVIDRHVASYAGELEAVAGEVEQKAPIKEETPLVVATDIDVATKEETHTTTVEENVPHTHPMPTVAESETVEEVAEDAPAPKRRGRKPKAKE